MRETKLSEMMVLNATSDPMLISDRRMMKRQVTVTELAGTWLLLTLAILL
jgi:hypothetical protein